MNLPITAPLTVAPDALEHVAMLGMQAEFESMLDYVVRNVSGLQRIDVTLAPPYDTGPDDTVLIEAIYDPVAYPERRVISEQVTDWRISTHSPDVLRHFCLLVFPGNDHDG